MKGEGRKGRGRNSIVSFTEYIIGLQYKSNAFPLKISFSVLFFFVHNQILIIFGMGVLVILSKNLNHTAIIHIQIPVLIPVFFSYANTSSILFFFTISVFYS